MDSFSYQNDALYCDQVPVETLVSQLGTPLYVYSALSFGRQFDALDQAFAALDHTICFAVKSNSNLSVLQLFSQKGSGFDIVSAGELYRVVRAGGDPRRAVFAGVGKSSADIKYALEQNILFFSVESAVELLRINAVAEETGSIARVCVRVNPDVDPQTHKYITTGKSENKFGLDFEAAKQLYQQALSLPCVEPVGVQMHIGSQITSIAPFVTAVRKLAVLVGELRGMGVSISYVDIGGGLGIVYSNETPPSPAEFAAALLPELVPLDTHLILEPGRFLSGNAGIMLTRIEYIKQAPTKQFVIVDAGMNDLIRPALYQAYHDILPVTIRPGAPMKVDIVGPICETGDFFGQDRILSSVSSGDCLAIKSTGAYGFVMASNYNSRPRAAEVMVNGDSWYLIRRRETWADLIEQEIACTGK